MSYYNQPQNDGYVLENDFELQFMVHWVVKISTASHCLRLGRAGFDFFFSDKAVG